MLLDNADGAAGVAARGTASAGAGAGAAVAQLVRGLEKNNNSIQTKPATRESNTRIGYNEGNTRANTRKHEKGKHERNTR